MIGGVRDAESSENPGASQGLLADAFEGRVCSEGDELQRDGPLDGTFDQSVVPGGISSAGLVCLNSDQRRPSAVVVQACLVGISPRYGQEGSFVEALDCDVTRTASASRQPETKLN
ncbi:hypothetical protein MRB53_042265 [Persea americana]|nr:hypothetical protein MRB53_042265 [Persea americana]